MKKLIAATMQLLGDFRHFIKWHLPYSVAQYKTLEEHFNMTLDEIAMIQAATKHKLLKEYIVFNETESEAYIVLKVSQVRKLLHMRRKNTKEINGR